MKVISYNVNGIRAALSKDFRTWLEAENPDVLCLQETKAQPDQIDTMLFAEMGYTSYLHSAQKKGYSGVAIITKKSPDNVVIGMNDPRYDAEGRVIRADFGDVSVICVYIPSGSSGDVRQAFKMDFLEAFLPYVEEVRKTRPNLIVCGDYNICHKPIDINHPERQKGVSGFLPEERAWLTDLFGRVGWVDVYRALHPNTTEECYTWWSNRGAAYEKNVGWRLDYQVATPELALKVAQASIYKAQKFSDHAPLIIDYAN